MALKIYDMDGQLSLLSPGPQSCKYKPRPRRKSSSRELDELVAVPFLCLDLTPGHGDLLGDARWELRSPWRENGKVLNTGVAPRKPIFSSLARILEPHPDRRYYLSTTACLGILRRAVERGKELPEQLKAALMAQAGLAPVQAASGGLKAYHINQRDEGIDLGGVSGALMATANMQMQTFVTGDPVAFTANQREKVNCCKAAREATLGCEVRDLHDVAGALGAEPGMKQQTFIREGCLNPWDTQQKRIILPDGVSQMGPQTLGRGGARERSDGLPSGGAEKSGLCDDDAGADGGGGHSPGGLLFAAAFSTGAGAKAGGIGFSQQAAPTLKGSSSGNCMPSVLCLNDQGGAVMSVSEDATGTLRAQEHGHQPLVFENHGIDARYTGPHRVAPTISARAGTGGNNLPLVAAESEEKTPILRITATDHHPVFNCKGPNAQYIGQDRLVIDSPLLIRRLTPLECERLQGFPDGWTAVPGASDSVRYKALGNSVAIPCVVFIIGHIFAAASLSLPYIREQYLCWVW